MTLPRVVTRDEWLRERKELLAKEKELTRRRDALVAERRRLPMVEVEKEYVFQGPDGEATLLDLFDGRRQLIVGHFMFDPRWEDGCPSCSAGVDELAPGLIESPERQGHLARVRVACAGREARALPQEEGLAPHALVLLLRHRLQLGEEPIGQPGTSCFLRVDDRIFHTYSTFGRGAEMLGGSYYWLDLTALGRQEEWEEPKGRADAVRSATPDFAS
jgi:predicted dithiol-disulfide oxidoreductase (DUF899 family)